MSKTLEKKINTIHSSYGQAELKDVLYYFKTSVIHIGFEAVITVLCAAPLVFFSSNIVYQTDKDKILADFFGKVLFRSALIFSGVVFLYLLALVAYTWYSLCQVNESEVEKEIINQYVKKVTIIGILSGIIAYCIGATVVVFSPGWFCGVESFSLTCKEQFIVGVLIIGFGLLWAWQSWRRYSRIEVIIDGSQNDSVYMRLRSAIVHIFVLCLIAFALLIVFTRIQYSSESFEYYNLILAIYFGIYSAYVSTCYKLEIKESYPSERDCEKKSAN